MKNHIKITHEMIALQEQPKPYSRTPMTQKTNPSDNFMNDPVIKGSSELPVDNTQTKVHYNISKLLCL